MEEWAQLLEQAPSPSSRSASEQDFSFTRPGIPVLCAASTEESSFMPRYSPPHPPVDEKLLKLLAAQADDSKSTDSGASGTISLSQA
jgi:hypothetical protein